MRVVPPRVAVGSVDDRGCGPPRAPSLADVSPSRVPAVRSSRVVPAPSACGPAVPTAAGVLACRPVRRRPGAGRRRRPGVVARARQVEQPVELRGPWPQRLLRRRRCRSCGRARRRRGRSRTTRTSPSASGESLTVSRCVPSPRAHEARHLGEHLPGNAGGRRGRVAGAAAAYGRGRGGSAGDRAGTGTGGSATGRLTVLGRSPDVPRSRHRACGCSRRRGPRCRAGGASRPVRRCGSIRPEGRLGARIPGGCDRSRRAVSTVGAVGVLAGVTVRRAVRTVAPARAAPDWRPRRRPCPRPPLPSPSRGAPTAVVAGALDLTPEPGRVNRLWRRNASPGTVATAVDRPVDGAGRTARPRSRRVRAQLRPPPYRGERHVRAGRRRAEAGGLPATAATAGTDAATARPSASGALGGHRRKRGGAGQPGMPANAPGPPGPRLAGRLDVLRRRSRRSAPAASVERGSARGAAGREAFRWPGGHQRSGWSARVRTSGRATGRRHEGGSTSTWRAVRRGWRTHEQVGEPSAAGRHDLGRPLRRSRCRGRTRRTATRRDGRRKCSEGRHVSCLPASAMMLRT